MSIDCKYNTTVVRFDSRNLRYLFHPKNAFSEETQHSFSENSSKIFAKTQSERRTKYKHTYGSILKIECYK